MRNCFVSYAHRLDQDDSDEFRKYFSYQSDQMVFSDRSLKNYDLSNYTEDYIKSHFISPKIKNSSVTIILIGQETGGRWWVDWEIYHSLRKSFNNDRNALLGILLPHKKHFIPQRLTDNLHMGKIINMPSSKFMLEYEIEQAFAKRSNQPNLSRPLRERNSYIY